YADRIREHPGGPRGVLGTSRRESRGEGKRQRLGQEGRKMPEQPAQRPSAPHIGRFLHADEGMGNLSRREPSARCDRLGLPPRSYRIVAGANSQGTPPRGIPAFLGWARGESPCPARLPESILPPA